MNIIEECLIQSSYSHVGYIMILNKQINRYFMPAGKRGPKVNQIYA